MAGDDWDYDTWDYDAIEEAAYNEEECSCFYEEDGSTKEWCDVCMFGTRRANYYRMREYALQNQEKKLETVKNTLITNELMYRVHCIEEEEDVNKKLEVIQSMLRYLWDKQVYLSKHSGLLTIVRQKCNEWMNDPAAESIQSTIIMTLEILSHTA